MFDLSNIFRNYSVVYAKKYLLLFISILSVGIKLRSKYIILFALIPLLYIIYFFRIPKFTEEPDDKYAFSPAYGKIIKIQERDGLLQIAIFINLWDAHIQYAPYKGVIQKQTYKPGMFHPAYIFKKGEYNEKLIHNITTSKGVMSVAQISGVIARNIERFVDEGHEIAQNQEIGLICFGSRCDLFIPLENQINILVKEGDKVQGGITKLVEFLN